MPTEQTSFTDKERQLVELVAFERGITFEEASNQLASEQLVSRVRTTTGHGPARVYSMPPKKK